MGDSSNRSFTFETTCPCGAKFYYSHATADGYGFSETRNQAAEKYDIFMEEHGGCTSNVFYIWRMSKHRYEEMKNLLVEAKEEIVKLRKEANELPSDWKL